MRVTLMKMIKYSKLLYCQFHLHYLCDSSKARSLFPTTGLGEKRKACIVLKIFQVNQGLRLQAVQKKKNI